MLVPLEKLEGLKMGPEEIRFLAIMGAAYLGLMVVYGSIRIGAWVWSVMEYTTRAQKHRGRNEFRDRQGKKVLL